MLTFFRSPTRLRPTAAFTAAIFFYVTLSLSVNQDGIGFSQAWAGTPSEKKAPLGSVYVFKFQRAGNYVSESAVRRIDEYYRTLISMNSKVSVVTKSVQEKTPEKPLVKTKPLKQDRLLESADKDLWKGKSLLEKRKWSAAANKFSKAVKNYEKRIELLEDMDKMVEAQLFLALARFAQGYDDDGEEALAKVVVLRPDLVVDRRWRSPSFDQALERLKQGLARVPTGEITVSCPLAGCTIYVDGLVKGVNSVTISNIARGHHYIRTVAPGYKPWASKVFTPGKGETRRVDAAMKREKRARKVAVRKRKKAGKSAKKIPPSVVESFVREGRYGPRFLTAVRSFCAQSGSAHLVFGIVNRVGNQYTIGGFLYSAKKRKVSHVATAMVQRDLSDLQVKLLSFEQKVTAAIQSFPSNKLVRGTPAIYAVWNPPPKPVVVAPKPKTRNVAVAASTPSNLMRSPKTKRATRNRTRVPKANANKISNNKKRIKAIANYAAPSAPKKVERKRVVKRKKVRQKNVRKRIVIAPTVEPQLRKKQTQRKKARSARVATVSKAYVPVAPVQRPNNNQNKVMLPVIPGVNPAPSLPQQPALNNNNNAVPTYKQPAIQPQPAYIPQPAVQPYSPKPVYQPTQQQQQPTVYQPAPNYAPVPVYTPQPGYNPLPNNNVQQPARVYVPQRPAVQPQRPAVQPQQPVYQPQLKIEPQYQVPRVATATPSPAVIPPQTSYTSMTSAPANVGTIPMTVPDVLSTDYLSSPWYTKWWLWTIVGSAVVGGVVAAILVTQPAPIGEPKGWTASVRW